MTAPDSTKFTRDDLSRHQSTIIMIFNPDCEHCRQVTGELLSHEDLFKKIRIIMVSAFRFSNIKQFYDDFHLQEHPNFIAGRDAAYQLGTFYNIHSLPTLFAYNKKGKLLGHFEGRIKAEKVAAIF